MWRCILILPVLACSNDKLAPTNPRLPATCDLTPRLVCAQSAVHSTNGCGLDEVVEQCCAGCVEGACREPSVAADQCVGDELWSFNDCNEPLAVLAECCAGCANAACVVPSASYFSCVEDDVYGFDECDQAMGLERECCAGCTDGACNVPALAANACLGDDVFAFDECGNPVALVTACCAGCAHGACLGGAMTASIFSSYSGTDLPIAVILDGDVTTGFHSPYNDWQYTQIDFGCAVDGPLRGFRRHMTASPTRTTPVRAYQGESIQYMSAAGEWTYMTGPTSSGWGSDPMTDAPYRVYGAAQRAWFNVEYGWSVWNCLEVPTYTHEVRFLWDGDGDTIDEVEFFFGDASPCE